MATERRWRSTRRDRRTVLRSLGVAAVGLTSVATRVSSSVDDGPTEIDSPTVIEEPGEYELVADLAPAERDQSACIVIQSDGVTLDGNGHTIDGSGFDSCIAVSSEFRDFQETLSPVIRDVVVRGSTSGISATLSEFGAEYTNVTAVENGVGFRFFVSGGTLRDCIAENNDVGVSLEGDDAVWLEGGRVDIENCTLESNERWGLGLGLFSGAGVSDSRIVRNGIGVKSHSSAIGGTFEGCHICRNEHYGIDSDSDPGDDPDLYDDPERDFPFEPRRDGLIMATDNYWGAPNGPSSFGTPEEPFTDPETDRPADGDGDAISQGLEAGVSNVRFDPFVESPFEDVGARRR